MAWPACRTWKQSLKGPMVSKMVVEKETKKILNEIVFGSAMVLTLLSYCSLHNNNVPNFQNFRSVPTPLNN